MLKILFLINTLGGGGAEKVLVNLVNNMDREKYDITVETMFSGGVNADLLAPHIRYIHKDAPCPHGIAYIIRLIPARFLYRYFIRKEKYDIIVAYMHGAPVKVISGCPYQTVKKVAWLHNGKPATGTFFKFWNRKKDAFAAYRCCDSIVGVAQSVANAFSDYTGIRDIVEVVYNTNDVTKIRILAKKMPERTYELPNGFRVCSVGRLSPEKGFDRLIRVSAQLRQEGIPLSLEIIGAGSEETALRAVIAECDAQEWCRLAGFQKNPYPFVAGADLFVCSSRDEGLSTAVTEAIILGVPVVSTDVSGAKEILGAADEYGIVTENSEDGILAGMRRMLGDTTVLAKYREKVKERASFFDTRECVAQSERLFDRLTEK